MFNLVLLAFSTLVSEDLACIAAGVLVANGQLTFAEASTACIAGIWGGDMLLYLAGRLLGRTRLQSWLKPSHVDKATRWLERSGWQAILLSRFTPGLRLPTYVAAGFLKTNAAAFASYFAIAAVLWVPLLVGITSKLGSQWVESHLSKGALIGLALLLFFGRRLPRWEFWPIWAVYLPLVPYLCWLAVRRLSVKVFMLANPAIPTGGLVGESKVAILNALPAGYVAPFRYFPEVSKERLASLPRPFVLKPNVGERGSGVRIIRNVGDLPSYAEDVIVQDYVPGVEFGVFYYRYPHEERGRISSITRKLFPHVTGDGRQTLEQLIRNNERASQIADVYLRRLDGSRVPAPGETVALAELGSHCRGAVFLNGFHLWTPALEGVIDRISRSYAGFYFGRYDVRAASVEAFQNGQFTIIELNGVASEATHIYDPAVSVWEAYKTMAHHWRVAFEIGSEVRAGAEHTPSLKLMGPENRPEDRKFFAM